MPSFRSVAAAALLGLGAVANADSLTCQSLASMSSISIDLPLTLDYTTENNEYWSTGCAALKPACIIKPASAAEMSTVIKTLSQNNETFAVKSGGHNPNQNFSSIDGGPLISTAELNEVTLDRDAMTVRVGPGNRWEDVHKVLDGTNTTIIGGRIGNVGVGGYILGGGLSFLTAEYGWAANNLVEVELVLANGTITTASATNNADLFKALKGGGANFGVVTTYTLKAHPIGDVWGGNLIFTASDATDKALLAALQNFTQNYPDEKAGIILTSEITLTNLVHIWIMFLFYDGPSPPAGVFDMFTDLNPGINNAKTRSYYDLLSYNNWAVLKGSAYTIATETTPLLAQDASDSAVNTTLAHLEECYAHWVTTSKSHAAIPGLVASLAFQPYPASFASKARAVDPQGDLIAFDDAADRIIFEFDYSYLRGLSAVDVAADEATVELYGGMKDIVDAAVADGRAPDVYRPLFMNDGYFRQDYWGRLDAESRALAEGVRASVDPTGFWAGRSAGGFRL
ncbi:fad binding domain-containing protein [Diplodia corticola]|uniref:Fad binding domain-containing protein n=1 Tax=Diplodia corticola TaxID=236234 RepID=A0A1J9QUA8_9PEZI|nr:fad binding domain-containing protein [Diplodia corticola]OJD31570.1 fad binding domain-containing protein [Diplodia corticola]